MKGRLRQQGIVRPFPFRPGKRGLSPPLRYGSARRRPKAERFPRVLGR